ncbi:OmpA family protein [Saprospiraceae bacterium]|nr:OmpA family protein [Saprospiraceae bacterium]
MSKFLKEENNPFGLSVGDLMAALLLIFVLLLMATLLKLQKERENVMEVAKEHLETKQNIYEDLNSEFIGYLKDGTVSIDSNTLMMRFISPKVEFASGEDDLNPYFKTLLNDFFPRYITILEKYKKDLREIRIEGHTDTDYIWRGINEYFYNMELSQNRTRSALSHCLRMIYKDTSTYSWVKPLITANGLSSSKLILDKNGNEDSNASRRVEFRIRTNAEEKLDIIYSKYMANNKNELK